MDAQEDFSSLSIDERLQNKVWKARQSAYTELYDLFRKTVNDSDFTRYEECLKNIATDVNAVAQETGLNTIYEYVNNAPNASRTGGTVVPALVSKCLGAPKASTKQKATDIILLYAEVDVVDPIVELVLPGIQAKQPKLVAQTVIVLRELVRQFGVPSVNPKPLIKILPKLFGHVDKNVRAEAYTLTVEIYKWIGSALTPSLSELKPVQMKELEEAFGKLPMQRPSPERFMRSQQQKMVEATAVKVGIGESHNGAAGDSAVMESLIDPYDLADPIDITSKLPGNFFELLASKKWQERREALDLLLASAKTPKVMYRDYFELLSALAKRINDANILLVGVTANCIEAIATGLRADFEKYRGLVVPPLIEKLKERKPVILEQVANALHGVFSYMPIVEIAEAVAIAVKHKNPQIRTQSVKLITRQLQIIHNIPSKLETKSLVELMLKTLEDADGTAREASAEGLGTLMNVVGERSMLAFMNSVDEIKRNKIKEFCGKAQTKSKQSAIKKPSPPLKKTAPVLKKMSKPVKASPSKPEPMMVDETPALPTVGHLPLKRKLSTTQSTNTKNKKPTLSMSKPQDSPATTTTTTNNAKLPKKATKLPPTNEPQEIKFKYSTEDSEARVTEFIPAQLWEDLGSSQWKARLASMESLYAHFGSGVELPKIEAEIVIRSLSKKPGWKEMNFQVMTKFYNVMQLLASDCPSFSRSSAAIGIPGIVEKLGDAKLKKPAGECLVAFAEATTLQFVLSQSYPIWKKAKSPKIVTDAFIWIHQALLDFGISDLRVHDLIDFVKNGLANTNPTVRTKAVSVLGVLRMYLGTDIIAFVQDVSPALMAIIEKEFEKVSKMDPPQPTKTASALKAKASRSNACTSDVGDGTLATCLDTLIPRTDISHQLGQVALDCSDANWKKRKEGLDQVVTIIESANKHIKPNLGDFPGVLRQRLVDSNKILQIQAVEITGLLVLSMGKPFEKYVKFLSGNLTSVLSDNKATVRNAGVATLNIIRDSCGLDGLMGAFGTSLASDSPILRKELLTWLYKSMNELDQSMVMADYSQLISPILSCLQDRNGEVRKAAQSILPSVAMSTGFEKVMRKASELNNTQRQTVMPFVESIRGSVPAKPTNSTSSIASLTAKAKRLSTSSTAPSPPTAPEILRWNATPMTDLAPDSDRRSSRSKRRRSSGSWSTDAPATTKATRTSVGSSSASSLHSNISATLHASPPLLTNDLRAKHQRSKEEPRWQFDVSRTDLVESLQCTCESHIHSDIWRLMFSSNHNAERDRLNALTQLDECITKPELSMEKYGLDFDDMKKRYLANSDLLFKYLTIRFFDTSTSMLIRCLDLAHHLVGILNSEGAILSEYEAISFIPFLINKIGDPKEAIRAKIRSILNGVCTIYPPSKMVNFLLDSSTNSKNPKARTECLDEIGALLQQNGIGVMLPNKSLPLITAHVGDRDAGVRNAALNTIAQVYILIGNPVFKYVGHLGEKEKGLVEERLKRIMPLTSSCSEKDGIQQVQQHDTTYMDIVDSPPTKRTPRSSLGSSHSQLQPGHFGSNTGTKPLSRNNEVSPMEGVVHPCENTTTSYHARKSELVATDLHQSTDTLQQSRQPEQQVYTVDYIIKQLALCTDPQENIEAHKHLVKHLNTTPELTTHEVDALVKAIILQVRVAYSMVDTPDSVPTRLCKHIVNTLVLLFSKGDLASAVVKETLISLLEELATRLLDERILSLESGTQLSKALNVAMVKILENCQPNTTFSALLSILGKCATKLRPNDSPSGKETKYTELVMKCLWKLTKTIQDNLRSCKLLPNQLLFDINEFFQLAPPDEWKRRMRENVPLGELPLRTVKTLLLEIVNGLGERVFDCLALIDNPQSSNIYPYLHHMLDACKKKGGIQQQHQHDEPTGTAANQSSLSNRLCTSVSDQSSVSPDADSDAISQQRSLHSRKALSTSVYGSAASPSDININDVLKGIFDKIGTKDKSKEGIAELYEFQKKHPLAENKVNGYLSKTGSYFQRYIQRGLDTLAENDRYFESSP